MQHHFKTEQWIPYPLELVFAFFANPHNLPLLMQAWQRTRVEEAMIVSPPPRPLPSNPAHRLNSLAAGKGSKITFSFKPFPYAPLRVPWEAEINEFTWNKGFSDTAVRSPLSYWIHHHSFVAETRTNPTGIVVQGTLVKDYVEYGQVAGEGFLGSWMHGQLVRPMMKRTFRARQKQLIQLLPSLFGAIMPVEDPLQNQEEAD